MRSSQGGPANARLPMAQFYGEGQDEEPTEFEVELDGKFGISGKREVFRYRLVVSHDQERVLEEELVYFPLGRPKRLFSRRGQDFRFGGDYCIRRNDPPSENQGKQQRHLDASAVQPFRQRRY